MRTLLALTVLAAAGLLSVVATTSPAQAAQAHGDCAIRPIMGFGRAWSQPDVRRQLGCATSYELGTYAAYQPFQGGFMIWRDDTDEILVFDYWGRRHAVVSSWHEGLPDRATVHDTPAHLQQPKRGFGDVWLSYPAVLNSLRWAVAEEVPTALTFQPFQHGTMIWTPESGVLVLSAPDWYVALR